MLGSLLAMFFCLVDNLVWAVGGMLLVGSSCTGVFFKNLPYRAALPKPAYLHVHLLVCKLEQV